MEIPKQLAIRAQQDALHRAAVEGFERASLEKLELHQRRSEVSAKLDASKEMFNVVNGVL